MKLKRFDKNYLNALTDVTMSHATIFLVKVNFVFLSTFICCHFVVLAGGGRLSEYWKPWM